MAKLLNINKQKDLKEVVEHYLDYPYPSRDPEDEKIRLLAIHGENLMELNHHLFKGKQDFNHGFRVLIAGGGTGDSSTFFGAQLKGKKAEVVYLDFSKNSMEIAKKRAQIRGLKNIKFINDSIYNIPNLNLGKFDYINCSGVLHHLSSPPEGLKILQQSLKPEGGMGLMVYAKYGRTAIYQLQDVMRMVNEGVTSRAEEVHNAKIVLNGLPNTNWFLRSQDLITDIKNYGDVGIYDLLLHKQDRCYSIAELYDFVEDAGLNFVEFSETIPRLSIKLSNYIKDSALLSKLQNLPIRKQHEIAEIINGGIIKHTFYASNIKDSVAKIDDLDNAPIFFGIKDLAPQVYNYLKEDSYKTSPSINFQVQSAFVPQGMNITIPISRITRALFENLKDESNAKSFREIFDNIQSKLQDVSDAECIEEVKKTLTPIIDAGLMVIRHKNVFY